MKQVIDFWLFLAKYVFLGLLYLFLFWAVRVIAAEARKSAAEKSRAPESNMLIETEDGGIQTVRLNNITTIGRLPANDIALDDHTISGQHARIVRRGDAWLLEDLGSSNGTFLNDAPLSGRLQLHSGDRIRVGRSTMTVELRGSR